MRQYPLTPADVISQEDIDAGRVNLVYNYKTVIDMVNLAFYDGFIVGICDEKEAFENITTEERLLAAVTAIQALAKFQGRPDPIEELLKKKLDGTGV